MTGDLIERLKSVRTSDPVLIGNIIDDMAEEAATAIERPEARVSTLDTAVTALKALNNQQAEQIKILVGQKTEWMDRATRLLAERNEAERKLETLDSSHRDLAYRLAEMGRERNKAFERLDRAVHWLRRYQKDEHLADDDCEELDALIAISARAIRQLKEQQG